MALRYWGFDKTSSKFVAQNFDVSASHYISRNRFTVISLIEHEIQTRIVEFEHLFIPHRYGDIHILANFCVYFLCLLVVSEMVACESLYLMINCSKYTASQTFHYRYFHFKIFFRGEKLKHAFILRYFGHISNGTPLFNNTVFHTF